MSINVITSSTDDRNKEIEELFNEMKPYLLEGKTYNQALSIVKNSSSTYSHTRWFKELVEYGESQGFPKSNFSYSDRYGLFGVQKVNSEKSLTGVYWVYKYSQEGKLRRIFDNDLCRLREKVLGKGLEWRVTNKYKAEHSFNLNKDLQENKRKIDNSNKGRKSSSGVKYVSKYKRKYAKRGFYWVYRHDGNFLQAPFLKELYEKIIDKGYEWLIIDEKLYKDNLNEEEKMINYI